MKTCNGCKYKIEMQKHIQFCMRFPPTSHLVMQQDKFGTQTGSANTYPVVNDQSPACGEFSEAIKIVS